MKMKAWTDAKLIVLSHDMKRKTIYLFGTKLWSAKGNITFLVELCQNTL